MVMKPIDHKGFFYVMCVMIQVCGIYDQEY